MSNDEQGHWTHFWTCDITYICNAFLFFAIVKSGSTNHLRLYLWSPANACVAFCAFILLFQVARHASWAAVQKQTSRGCAEGRRGFLFPLNEPQFSHSSAFSEAFLTAVAYKRSNSSDDFEKSAQIANEHCPIWSRWWPARIYANRVIRYVTTVINGRYIDQYWCQLCIINISWIKKQLLVLHYIWMIRQLRYFDPTRSLIRCVLRWQTN